MDPPLGTSDREKNRPPPVLLGRYRVEKSLGAGGMGEVLLAHDELLHRKVALKRLLTAGDDRDDRRRAILKEARRASQVNHPRIAAIYDVLDLPDDIVLVMEYVGGVTLRQRLADPLPLPEFMRLATQCVEGIKAAHAHGVIHRDIKPENLMVTDGGQIKILDFGIALRTGAVQSTTTSHSSAGSPEVAGTPHYMAPEAHLGLEVDARADIFSLGIVFYEMLTARRPFEGATYAELSNRILNASPPPVHELNPAAGAGLSRLVERMLAKDPAERFASATEVMECLNSSSSADRAVATHETPAFAVRASPTPGGAPDVAVTTPGSRRARWSVGRSVLAIVLVAVAGAWVKGAATPALPKDLDLAILAPRTPDADPDFAGMALGYVELLSTRLRRRTGQPGFQMASFTEGREEHVGSASDARKILGSNVALIPTLTQSPDLLRARLELREGKTNRLVAARTIDVPSSHPFELLERMEREALDLLRLKPRGDGASLGVGFNGAGTLRFYLQGMGRLRAAESETDVRRAVRDLENACRAEPGAAVPRAGLAAAQFRMYQISRDSSLLDLAEATARHAITLDASRPEPHRVLAAALESAKRPQESLMEFTRARDLDPTDDHVCLRLARTYARLGETEKEKGAYLEVIEMRPHAWKPWWWLATWYYRSRRLDESLHAYREMIRRSPAYAVGYASLGGVLVLTGEYDAAIDTLKRSVELRPTQTAFANLGTAYFNSGRFAEAVDAYNQSFQFGNASYVAWLNLGDAYYWLRDRKDQAAEAYGQAIQLGRDSILARAENGQYADPTIVANLATIFPKLGQPDSARAYLGRALAADSTHSMVQYCAALTCWQLNEKQRALAWLERSVRSGYPIVWLEDSPIFHEWRGVPAFRALVSGSPSRPPAATAGG